MANLFAFLTLAAVVFQTATGFLVPLHGVANYTLASKNLKADACKAGWTPMAVFSPRHFINGRDWYVLLAPTNDPTLACTTWNFAPSSSGSFDHITLVRLYTYQDGHKSPNGDQLTKRFFHNAAYDYDKNNARLTILDTDYNTWGLVDVCDGTSHFPLILSRRPLLPANYLQLEGKLHALGYDISQLIQQDTSKCV